MKRLYKTIFCVACLSAWMGKAYAAAIPVVTVDAPTLTVERGTSFAIDVDIPNASDVDAFQLDLNHDRTVLKAT